MASRPTGAPVGSTPAARTSVAGSGMIGRVLGGRYRLVSPLGTGASAAVFLADDVRLRREVAVKVLHPALAADPGFLRRFEAEAQVAAGLRHPNLLAVHDWGEEDGTAFLVTEHLEGGSLRDLLDRGFRASPSQALLLGLQAARGLDHAHRRGLVHRDVKPANLLFDADGRLRVADFGLAKAIAEAAITEPMGAMLGTARYASPEQAEGRQLDGRSDVYSLGLVLIEALTGRVPFAAETSAATLLARIGHAVAPPPEAGPLTDALMAVGRPKPVDRPNAATFGRLLKERAADLSPPAPLPIGRPSRGTERAAAQPDEITVLPPTPMRASGDPAPLPKPRPITSTRSSRRAADEAPAPHGERRPVVFDADLDADAASDLVDPDERRVVIDDEGSEGERLASSDSMSRHRERRPRRWRRRLVGLTLVFALLGGGGAAAVTKPWLSTVDVPDLSGLTMTEAAIRLKPSRLKPRVAGRDFHETVEVDRVLSFKPARAREESFVGVELSDGPRPRRIPPSAGRPVAEVQALLEAEGLVVKVVPKDHESALVGVVLDTDPRENLEAARGDTVTVVVSDGPAARAVADVANKPYDEAAATLTAAGFSPIRTDIFHDTVAAGAVISSAPAAATLLKPGKPVALTVSKGPDLVVVPAVSGATPAAAQATIQAAGLTVSATFGPPSGKVFDTDPKQGTKAKRGSSIILLTR